MKPDLATGRVIRQEGNVEVRIPMLFAAIGGMLMLAIWWLQ